MVSPEGDLVPRKPLIKERESNGNLEIYVKANDEKTIESILIGLKRRYPKLDITKFKEALKHEVEYIDEPLHGTISIDGKKIFPAVDVNGYGRSNYLSLFIGAREYRLGKSANCLYHYDVDDNSITETFTVKKVAEFTSTYTICKMDEKDEQENCVLVKHSFKNATGKKKVFVLKAVYNLCLGENRGFHYSTALKSDIGGEYVVLPSKDESWIISSDSKAVMANKDVMELSSPSTSFNPGNSFESLLSYNNSSLGLYWDAVELDDGASAEYSYKINFSTNDFQNSGKLYPVEKPEEAKAEKAEEPKKEPVSTESSGYIDPSKLNEEYVQQLINHINSLEQSDPSLNRLKIQQLQTEVDEVLQVLRSRK